jgi:hypothetical protein
MENLERMFASHIKEISKVDSGKQFALSKVGIKLNTANNMLSPLLLDPKINRGEIQKLSFLIKKLTIELDILMESI